MSARSLDTDTRRVSARSEAQFIRESAPADEALKIDLLAHMDTACPAEIVIASSSSKFLSSRLTQALRAAACVQLETPAA